MPPGLNTQERFVFVGRILLPAGSAGQLLLGALDLQGLALEPEFQNQVRFACHADQLAALVH